MGMEAKSDLLEIVAALTVPRTFTSRLHGGQKQRHQDADDGDHH